MRLMRRKTREQDSFWCDTVVADANASRMRSVEIAAPPKLVFRWLCQLRVAAYSFDWADSARRRSPRELLPGLDQLELGQTVMGVYELAHFVPGRELTVRLDRRLMGDHGLAEWYAPTATTYRVSAHGASSTRLVAKSATAFPGGIRWRLTRIPARWTDRLILKRQLRTLKRLAERDYARERIRPASVEELPLPVVTLPARKRESVAN
jgi:hypothetical protein